VSNNKKDYKFTDTEHVKGFDIQYNYLNNKKDLPRDYNKVVELTEENIDDEPDNNSNVKIINI
jgi:hypothetical protein